MACINNYLILFITIPEKQELKDQTESLLRWSSVKFLSILTRINIYHITSSSFHHNFFLSESFFNACTMHKSQRFRASLGRPSASILTMLCACIMTIKVEINPFIYYKKHYTSRCISILTNHKFPNNISRSIPRYSQCSIVT